MKTLILTALSVALLCGVAHAGEYNIPSLETVSPSAEDLALAKLIQSRDSCACPATGICSCGAGCDCKGGTGALVKLVPGSLKMDAAPKAPVIVEEPGDVIVINGVKHYRLGSAAARAVGLTAPAPVAQAWPMAQPSFPFGGYGGGFSGGACSGGS